MGRRAQTSALADADGRANGVGVGTRPRRQRRAAISQVAEFSRMPSAGSSSTSSRWRSDAQKAESASEKGLGAWALGSNLATLLDRTTLRRARAFSDRPPEFGFVVACSCCRLGRCVPWVKAGTYRYGHEVPAHPRTETQASALPGAATRIVAWDAAAQSIHILVDSGAFAELRDELLRRIPVHNPEWTDVNASDPGVTLLDLLAYLGEGLLSRFNQLAEQACSRLPARLCARSTTPGKRVGRHGDRKSDGHGHGPHVGFRGPVGKT
jgi:hypothetical protein